MVYKVTNYPDWHFAFCNKNSQTLNKYYQIRTKKIVENKFITKNGIDDDLNHLNEVLENYERFLTNLINSGNYNAASVLIEVMNWLSDYEIMYELL